MCSTLIYTSSVPPIKSAMDFLYCRSKIEKDDSQVKVAFKERRESTVSETEMIQLNTCSWMLIRKEVV